MLHLRGSFRLIRNHTTSNIDRHRPRKVGAYGRKMTPILSLLALSVLPFVQLRRTFLRKEHLRSTEPFEDLRIAFYGIDLQIANCHLEEISGFRRKMLRGVVEGQYDGFQMLQKQRYFVAKFKTDWSQLFLPFKSCAYIFERFSINESLSRFLCLMLLYMDE